MLPSHRSLKALLLSATVLVAVARAQDRRPNIVFIFSDDHAAQAIGAYGSKVNETPKIDRLAKEGMLFRNAFVTNSICAPSRAVVLTGKHSHLNGVLTNAERFDGSQTTFPKLLRKAGYETAMIGKWHLKSDPTGFDHWEVLIGQGPYYNPRMKTPEGTVTRAGYTTEVITERALSWLKARKGEAPFLLMCQHKAPHRNWAPGPAQLGLHDGETIPEPATLFDDWSGRGSAARRQSMTIARHLTPHDLKLSPLGGLDEKQRKTWDAAYGPKNAAFRAAKLEGKDLVRWKYQRYVKDYLRCVRAVDESVGAVLDQIDRSGLAENTIVVYSSDQGWFLGEHGWYDKRWMYEESLRTPLLVRWPRTVRAGSVTDAMVSNLDFAQTFLDVAGVEAPAEMQGASLRPLLGGERPKGWRRSIYYHYYEYPGAHDVRRHYGVRDERYKLIRFYGIDEWELYDLERDPDELRSVYGEPGYADVVTRMKRELARLRELYRVPEDTRPIPEEPTIRGQAELRRAAAQVELRKVLAFATGERPSAKTRPDPSGRPLSFGARCRLTGEGGVVFAQGGASFGYALFVEKGKPCAAVRNDGELVVLRGEAGLPRDRWFHLAAVLHADGRLVLHVDGRPVGERKALLLARKPADGLEVGDDGGSAVANYAGPTAFAGELAEVRLYWGAVGAEELSEWAGH